MICVMCILPAMSVSAKIGEITNYGFNQGLGEGVVLRLLRDEENNGWFISAGSSLYYWQSDKSFWQVTNFSKDTGSVFEFYEKDGSLYMSIRSGISIFEFETVENNLPKIIVQSVRVDGQSYEHPQTKEVKRWCSAYYNRFCCTFFYGYYGVAGGILPGKLR